MLFTCEANTFNVKCDARCASLRPADNIEWIMRIFMAHRSHRRCLITESMMKTNCCVYRNVLRLTLEESRRRRCWCAQCAVQTRSGDVNERSPTQAQLTIIFFLALPRLVVDVYKNKRREAWYFAAALPCAHSKRNSVSSYTVHPWISNFNKKRIFFRLHFVHLRCDSVSAWITKENFVFWYIFAVFFFISILISFRSVLTSLNENIGLRALVGLAVDKDNFVLCVHEPFEVKSLLLLCMFFKR